MAEDERRGAEDGASTGHGASDGGADGRSDQGSATADEGTTGGSTPGAGATPSSPGDRPGARSVPDDTVGRLAGALLAGGVRWLASSAGTPPWTTAPGAGRSDNGGRGDAAAPQTVPSGPPRQRSTAAPSPSGAHEELEPEGYQPECPPVSDPTVPTRAWQVQVLAAVDRCRSDLARSGRYDERQRCLRRHVDADLAAAVAAVGPSTRWLWLSDAWSGRRVEAAWGAVHHVRAVLPLLGDDEALPAHQLDARRLTALYLDKDDPRRVAVASDLLTLRVAGQPGGATPGADPVPGSATRRDRETVSHAIAAAYDENDQRYASLRGWRNRVYVAAGLSFLVLVVLVLMLELSSRGPDLVPLGTVPVQAQEDDQAATAGDTAGATEDATEDASQGDAQDPGTTEVSALMVVLLGSVAAFVTAVVATRSSGPTSAAYSLTPALASLRVPLGGLTALLGVLLLRSTPIPGLTAPGTIGEIAAASLLFGASQELFTRLIDARAREVEELAVNGGSSTSSA